MNTDNQDLCYKIRNSINESSKNIIECDQRVAQQFLEYGDPENAVSLILALHIQGMGTHGIATKLLLNNPSYRRMTRKERVRTPQRTRKRVERFLKRYHKIVEILETAKPPACNPLDPPFRPKHDKNPGKPGQNTSIQAWPPHLGPTERVILELLSYYTRGALIHNLINDAREIYGIELSYYQVTGALKRLLKRGLVKRVERGLYIAIIPSEPSTPAALLLVENARLESPYRKEPLTITSIDGKTLFDLAVEASRERANKATRLEIVLPLKWGSEELKKRLSNDGTRIVKVYYNRESNLVKAEIQVYDPNTPIGITTLNKWTKESLELLILTGASILLTLGTTPSVQGYLPDKIHEPSFNQKLYKIIKNLQDRAR